MLADAKEALANLLPLVQPNEHKSWLEEFKVCEKMEFDRIIQKNIAPESLEITMGEVIHHLSQITEGNAIIVTDVGQHQMVTTRYFRFKNPRTNVSSGGLGTMGFALPAAIGAKLGKPQTQVVAIIGDGGFQMTLQELGTIMQFNIPVKIIILNNEFLGMVRQWQQMFFESRYSFTEMSNPNFTMIAQGYNIASEKVTKREELLDALHKLWFSDDAFLLEVMVKKEENVFPMIPTGAAVSDVVLGL